MLSQPVDAEVVSLYDVMQYFTIRGQADKAAMILTKEIIYHFTCRLCKGWWSIATVDEWKPKKLYCTHCGESHTFSDVQSSTIPAPP